MLDAAAPTTTPGRPGCFEAASRRSEGICASVTARPWPPPGSRAVDAPRACANCRSRGGSGGEFVRCPRRAASRFVIDYDGVSALVTPHDPEYGGQLAGVAFTDAGLAIGGVRHQFRDEPGGFRARLCVEFPRLTLPRLLGEHRRHLAIEFSNWVESAFGVHR